MGRKSSVVTITLFEIIETFDINQFLKKFKLSKWKRGKYFLDRHIQKVFYKNIEKDVTMNNYHLDDIEIVRYSAFIEYTKSNIENVILTHLKPSQTKRRMKDIIKYSTLIKDGIDIGSPIYIQGNCINKWGGNVASNKLFQIDGSRRLVSYLINQKSNLIIDVISLKTNTNGVR